MLWPGTKYVSMNFKEKYRKLYAQNSFRMFSLRVGARVVPLRARLRPG